MSDYFEKPPVFQELGEENEEWRSLGDYYRQADNVTRGLTLSLSDVAPPPGSDFKGLPDIDFYRDEPNVMPRESPSLHEFSSGDWPPSAPTDRFFHFMVTTLYVQSREPWIIANYLLEFFANEVVSALSKVNHKKFSFKGNVFENYSMCTLKVKIFQKEDNNFAIEFQRRQGDGLTFMNVFNKARQFLTACGVVELSPQACGPVDLSPPPLPIQMASVVDEAALTALLDLATLTGAPSLQAEAAAALATIAEDDAQCVLLCTEHALQDVKALFSTSAPEVDYPAARIANLLAQRQEAAPHFAQQGFLPVMVEKIRSTTTCRPAREQLACALSTAVQRQSPIKSPPAFAKSLGECIDEMAAFGTVNEVVVQNLRSAQMALSSL